MESRTMLEDRLPASRSAAQMSLGCNVAVVPAVAVSRRLSSVVQSPQSPAKCQRKDCGPNWLPHEVFALIDIKRTMHMEEIDIVHSRDLMTPDINKWTRIAEHVMRSGYSPCFKDAAVCKTKWNQNLSDYKQISDFYSRSRRNSPYYWTMTTLERKIAFLLHQLSREVFDVIYDWYGVRPLIHPPHVRDTLGRHDANLPPAGNGVHEDDDCDGSKAEIEDPLQTLQPDVFETPEQSKHPLSPLQSTSIPMRTTAPPHQPQSPRTSAFLSVPPGITPHLLSSSETLQFPLPRRPGNTGVRRKNLSGHTVIAEATKATGAAMAAQMNEIAESSRDLERSKIEVQLRIFTEQMSYQREKDRRLYENASAANENARLSIMKQGEMVSCLSQLSNVLSAGLTMQTGKSVTHEDRQGDQAAQPSSTTEVLVKANENLNNTTSTCIFTSPSYIDSQGPPSNEPKTSIP